MGTGTGKGGTRPGERRRYPRGDVAWRIVIEDHRGAHWRGEMVALNPFGAKVRLDRNETSPPPGSLVGLQFSPPDGESPMALKGIVWRVDAGDDAAVVFSNLSTQEFLRLRRLTDNILGGPPSGMSFRSPRKLTALSKHTPSRLPLGR